MLICWAQRGVDSICPLTRDLVLLQYTTMSLVLLCGVRKPLYKIDQYVRNILD